MWWPEITLDVVQADLQMLGKNVDDSDDVEDIISCEWFIDNSAVRQSSSFDKWDILKQGLDESKSQIDSIRFRRIYVRTQSRIACLNRKIQNLIKDVLKLINGSDYVIILNFLS